MPPELEINNCTPKSCKKQKGIYFMRKKNSIQLETLHVVNSKSYFDCSWQSHLFEHKNEIAQTLVITQYKYNFRNSPQR